MAGHFAYQNTNLSTVNGFYAIEASNMSMFSTTQLLLSTTRYITPTFAAAGNCQGLTLALYTGLTYTTTFKDVQVELEEDTGGGVWVSRATTGAVTRNTITNSVTYPLGVWPMPFVFTAPYAVDTTAGKWRFKISQPSGSGSDWRILTSNGTAPFYVTWCDNASTYASNDYVVAGLGKVTIDQTATFRGILGTGDAANAICALSCRSTTPTTGNEDMFNWDTTATRTLTIDGLFVNGAHSAFRIGSYGSRCSFANQAIIEYKTTPTNGTARSGFTDPIKGSNYGGVKSSYYFYGEYPTKIFDTLGADANAGQPNVTTSNSTSWKNGWQVFLGKENIQGQGNTAANTLNGDAVGTAIVLTNNIAGQNRLDGDGSGIMTTSGFGIRIQSDSSSNYGLNYTQMCSNLVFDGVSFYNTRWEFAYAAAYLGADDATNRSAYSIQNCAVYGTSSAPIWLRFMIPQQGGLVVNNVATMGAYIFNGLYKAISRVATGVDIISGATAVYNSIGMHLNTASTWFNNIGASTTWTMTQCSITNGLDLMQLQGRGMTMTNNRFWGASGKALQISYAFDSADISDNKYNNCANTHNFFTSGITSNMVEYDPVFGDETANTNEVAFESDARVDYVISSPTNAVVVDETNLKLTVPGSHFGIESYDDTANDDRNWYTWGKMIRTGDGLADNEVRTSGTGKFAMKMTPNDGVELLALPNNTQKKKVPIGNLQNLTLGVTVWVKVAYVNYDDGVYVRPTLRVVYDGTSVATSVADGTVGAWQQLGLHITPTTTIPEITVEILGASDAGGSLTDFYVDDMVVAFPSGKTIDLGGLDFWSLGEPVTPPLATNSAAEFWNQLMNNYTIAGTFGNSFRENDLFMKLIVALQLSK